MPPKNRNKFGLSIPVDPRWKAFEGSGNTQSLPTTPSNYTPSTTSPTPQRSTLKSPRNTARSPRPPPPPPPKNKIAKSTATLETSETEELQRLVHAPPFWKSNRKLSKQLSMRETTTASTRDIAWEKRRKQMIRQEKRRNSIATIPGMTAGDGENLTDADLHELRGSIELGFGFSEEDGRRLCETLPALDLYFAISRQVSLSPMSTPRSQQSPTSSNGGQSTLNSPQSEESWRICSPGDSPKQVKMKLRHWAQAVACSLMQSSYDVSSS